jgi:hypothetical protein
MTSATLWTRARQVDDNRELQIRAVRTPDGETQLQFAIVLIASGRRVIQAGVTLDTDDTAWVTEMLDRGAAYVRTP